MVPPFFHSLLTPSVADISHYQLRNNNDYTLPNYKLTMSNKSFLPSTTRLWNALDEDIRNAPTLATFKASINQRVSDNAPCLSYFGDRKFGIIHARLRHNCSVLNYDLFRCNLVEYPSCRCGSSCENVFHFFMECPLCTQFRKVLYDNTLTIGDVTLSSLLYGDSGLTLDDNIIIFNTSEIPD